MGNIQLSVSSKYLLNKMTRRVAIFTCSLTVVFFKGLFYFFIREGKGESEKNINQLPPSVTGDQTHNLGM